jgi:branched-chain amino acid transport system ATP-binding protein
MLALARGLMSEPELLLLDEPTLGLAPQMCDLLFETIAGLRAQGLTILLAEQNVPRALELAATAYVVENGRIAVAGPARELAQDPRVQAAYLGQ